MSLSKALKKEKRARKVCVLTNTPDFFVSMKPNNLNKRNISILLTWQLWLLCPKDLQHCLLLTLQNPKTNIVASPLVYAVLYWGGSVKEGRLYLSSVCVLYDPQLSIFLHCFYFCITPISMYSLHCCLFILVFSILFCAQMHSKVYLKLMWSFSSLELSSGQTWRLHINPQRLQIPHIKICTDVLVFDSQEGV